MAKGFWSYARNDDAHLDNQITELRNRVAGEVALHLGRDIDMFQDIYDLRTGDDWEAALRANLSAATFLIPVLTPRYFERPWCREEVMTFLRLTQEAGIQPLIFPIYLVADRRAVRNPSDEVRVALGRFQHSDFSSYRFESVEQKRSKMVHDFAVDVADRIEGENPPYSQAAPDLGPKRQQGLQEKPKANRAKSGSEIPTLVVDPWPNRGDHTTIMAAIKAASPGDRIRIRPSTYPENVILDKELELIGDGEPGTVRVEVTTGNAMKCTATVARIENITFKRLSEDGKNVALFVTKGRAEFQNCRFRSESQSGVAVMGISSKPRFTNCIFNGGKQTGAAVHDNAKPVFESCSFSDNEHHGAGVTTGADPVFQRCRFKNNTQHGVFVYENGRGRFENCEFFANKYDGIAVKQEGRPRLSDCVIADSKYAGVRTEDATGGGIFERNVFRGNGIGAWDLSEGSEANVTRVDNREE